MNKIALGLVFTIMLAGCTSPPATIVPLLPETGETQPVTQPQYLINITDNTYLPATLRVIPGTTISIINDDPVSHTVTADNGEFNSGTILPDTTGSLVAPNAPGEYPFHCIPHQYMKGVLIVE